MFADYRWDLGPFHSFMFFYTLLRRRGKGRWGGEGKTNRVSSEFLLVFFSISYIHGQRVSGGNKRVKLSTIKQPRDKNKERKKTPKKHQLLVGSDVYGH